MKTVEYVQLTDVDREGITYWGQTDSERVSIADLDEAIEDYLDGWFTYGYTTDETIIEFDGFVRMALSVGSKMAVAESVLEGMLESWDEDYGDPDGYSLEVTQGMRQAAKVFVEAVASEYQPWACESVIRVRVPVHTWVQLHRPEWLEEREAMMLGEQDGDK